MEVNPTIFNKDYSQYVYLDYGYLAHLNIV